MKNIQEKDHLRKRSESKKMDVLLENLFLYNREIIYLKAQVLWNFRNKTLPECIKTNTLRSDYKNK